MTRVIEADTSLLDPNAAARKLADRSHFARLFVTVQATFELHWAMLKEHWKSAATNAIVQPSFFLLAMGFGLGSQMGAQALQQLGTSSYQAYVGPGMMGATAMLVAATEAMWPTFYKMRHNGIYRAIVLAPIDRTQFGISLVLWNGVRAVVAATCYLVVMAVFGVLGSPLAVLSPVIAALIAVCYSGAGITFCTHISTDLWFPVLYRCVIIPMMILGGVFYPVTELPLLVRYAVMATPLYHGVELIRALCNNALAQSHFYNLAFLVVFALLATSFAALHFDRNVRS